MIQSELLASVVGVQHGFAEASDPPAFWPGPLPDWKQVHGTRVAQVTAPAQAVGDADGLRTGLGGVPIGVVTADCVPILLARRDGSEIAALHAGWRGTLSPEGASIVTEFATKIAEGAGGAEDWVAAIGPCAGPCCYEVSQELARDFARRFGPLARPRYLDLAACNAQLLREVGITSVDMLRHCTICERGRDGAFRFHSYRRDQTPLRNRSQIRILI